LELQVGFQHLLGILADAELAQVLQIWQPLEHEDALDQSVGVLHLLDRLVVLALAEALEAPLAVHARVQEVLVDRRELARELAVELLDHLLVAFHGTSRADGPPILRPVRTLAMRIIPIYIGALGASVPTGFPGPPAMNATIPRRTDRWLLHDPTC